MGPKRVLFMDEISTGLDSSTTFEIVKYLADATHALRYTSAVALLQPAPEVYDLFDDVLLLAEGEGTVFCVTVSCLEWLAKHGQLCNGDPSVCPRACALQVWLHSRCPARQLQLCIDRG